MIDSNSMPGSHTQTFHWLSDVTLVVLLFRFYSPTTLLEKRSRAIRVEIRSWTGSVTLFTALDT